MADNVIVRVPEQQFIRGEDGYSPEVTIEDIAHGHSVTITDRDHPTGQSFNVMDGDSAYEQAVAGGYTGTEEQFNAELASFKELSEQAADSASTAAGAANRAQNYERHAGDAEDAARAYADIALIRMNSADTSAQAAATTATTFTEQTVPAAVNTINEAKADALTAVGNAQTTAVGAVQTESTTQQAAIQQKGDDVLDSIPSDYTTLSEDVDDLKSAFDAEVSNSATTVNLDSLAVETSGYINNYGIFLQPGSASHKIVKMDASSLRYVAFKSNSVLGVAFGYGVLKDADGNILQVFAPVNSTERVEFEIIPQDGNVLYISYYNGKKASSADRDAYYSSIEVKDYLSIAYAYESDIQDISEAVAREIMNETKYMTCAKKPFSFESKRLWFFGDSITYGYIDDGDGAYHQATNQFPARFSGDVGAASFVNWGVNGATLADNYTTISTHPLSCDFVFICGGVNDWQTGVTEAALKTTVTNICEHLKDNFTGEVIFVTPINEAGRTPISTPAQTLQNVRNVITQIALEYGFSVVQGWEFPFPNQYDNESYINSMFQDKLHPTELGYAMYAQALQNALC